MTKEKMVVKNLLDLAGININGQKPWDIKVNNENLYSRVLGRGSLGLGEAYMDGWWDCVNLDQFFDKVLTGKLKQKIQLNLLTLSVYAKSKFFNLQSKKGSKKVAERHYDLSTRLYMSFLDPYNQYTCGYFKNTDDLNIAQEQKLDLICKKLQLQKTDRVLDIGCGWGGFAKFASERYGCRVTGITISKSQAVFARDYTRNLPVSIVEADYRDLKGEFDKILICGMIEHVGYKNYSNIFRIVNQCLSEKGLFLLHTIGNNVSTTGVDPWIEKYIFPNSMLPSLTQLTKAADGLFILEDLQNFGSYYDQTLLAWFKNFDSHWAEIKKDYDERFYRMWKYYLLSCAGLFRSRQAQLWQFVYSKKGIDGGYQSVR